MIKRSGSRWFSTGMVALGLCACLLAPAWLAAQQQYIRWSRNDKGDSRPIQIDCDEAATWIDSGQRVLLLKGKIQIEQGDAIIRASQAMLWIDEQAKNRTGIYRVAIYAEGGVSLDLGTETRQGPLAYIELATHGKIGPTKMRNKKLVEESQLNDPLYLRGMAFKAALPAAGPAPVASQGVAPAVAFSRSDSPDASVIQQAQSLQPGTMLPPSTAPGPGSAGPQNGVQQPGMPAPPPLIAPYDVVPVPDAERTVSIRPRSSQRIDIQEITASDGGKASILSPGIIITIIEFQKNDPTRARTTVIEADRAVVWTKGDVKELLQGAGNTNPAPGQPKPANPQPKPGSELEFYLSGNVEIRNQITKDSRIIRCSEAYYDVNRTVAICRDSDFTIKDKTIADPIHLMTPELRQLNAQLYAWDTSDINASKLPYGPGLDVTTGQGTMTDVKVLKKSLFGVVFTDPKTGMQEIEEQRIIRAYNSVTWLEGIPIFYLPYIQADATDPLGPLHSLSGGYSKIFGIEAFVTWNIYDLLGIDPGQSTHWYLNTDYMSIRGPALGTDYTIDNFSNPLRKLFDISGKFEINVKAYGIDDHGGDVIGGNRGVEILYGDPNSPSLQPVDHPEYRGRFLSQLNWQEMPDGFSVVMQLAAVSDRNFLDQYFNNEFLNGPNEESFAYVKQQKNDWAWDILFQQRDQDWYTQTDWLPKASGYIIGQDFLDYFTYTGKASAGYGILSTAHTQPQPYEPTDIGTSTFRGDFFNEVDAPFQAGAFRIVPYAILDLTYYSNDLAGNDVGRVYDAGGIRASFPLSRLYPEIQSELFNVNGIYHKIIFSENFYWAHSNVSHLLLPQLDRLNDDESDQALRDIRPYQPQLNPANATFLNSGFFDPQLYALRKLVLNSVDTLDSIEVVELDVKQRWQTKRGLPGQEHIIDWMTLDLGVSLYPQPDRDDFGKVINYLTYDWTWAIGDRTSLFSAGWFDPYPNAARVWDFGVDFNRPDGTALSLVYRQIDPLESKEVTASINIPFSSKYSVTASTSYDFGVKTQNNTLTINRTGSDLTLSVGVSYDSILNNVGFVFELYPNLLPASSTPGNLLNSGLGQGR